MQEAHKFLTILYHQKVCHLNLKGIEYDIKEGTNKVIQLFSC